MEGSRNQEAVGVLNPGAAMWDMGTLPDAHLFFTF